MKVWMLDQITKGLVIKEQLMCDLWDSDYTRNDPGTIVGTEVNNGANGLQSSESSIPR